MVMHIYYSLEKEPLEEIAAKAGQPFKIVEKYIFPSKRNLKKILKTIDDLTYVDNCGNVLHPEKESRYLAPLITTAVSSAFYLLYATTGEPLAYIWGIGLEGAALVQFTLWRLFRNQNSIKIYELRLSST